MKTYAELFSIAPKTLSDPKDVLGDPLLAPAAYEPATEALGALTGQLDTAGLEFAVTNWDHLIDSHPGTESLVTLDSLADWLTEEGTLVKGKKNAEIFGVYTSRDGSRREDAVGIITALVLDCDGTGDWCPLQVVLKQAGFGHLLYRSPSHTPECPKWRCLLPFDKPYDVDTLGRARWENLYLVGRTIFGVLAQLSKGGFDYKTNNPERIWIVPARPSQETPNREVTYYHGATLSLDALLAITPEGEMGRKADYGEQNFELSLAGLVFQMAGLIGPKLSDSKFAVCCPRNSEHSVPAQEDEFDSSTVIFSANSRGAFDCKHGHARPDPTLPPIPPKFDLQHAMDLIEAKHPGTTEKANALLHSAASPASPLAQVTQKARNAERRANKLRAKAKEYRQISKTAGMPLDISLKAQEIMQAADAADAEAQEAQREAEATLALVSESLVFLSSDDDATLASHVIATLPQPAVFDQGFFYLYTNQGVWKTLDREALRRHVHDNLYRKVLIRTPTQADPGAVAPIYLNDNKLNGIVNFIHTLTANPGFFASRKPGVAFRNGMVSITDALKIVFEQPKPEHAQRHFIDADYVGIMPTPRWDTFLNDVMDTPEQVLLHEFLGACLFEDAVRFQRCVALVGFGNNGKSTGLDVIRALFPEEATAALSPTVWGKRFQISRLVGKLINIVDELPSQRVEDSDTFKKVITGGVCESELKNENGFAFTPKAGHIFAVNELPKTSDLSDGWYRRWAIIMMDRKIPNEKRDVRILEKLRQELPGIATKCVEGYIRLKQRGSYLVPETAVDAVLTWREENDAPLRFVRGYCEKDSSAWSPTEEIYNRYRREAQSDGTPLHEQVGVRQLGKTLARAGFQAVTKNNRRGWALKFKPLAGIGRG